MTREYKTAKCLQCGKQFHKTGPKHKFCSAVCKERHRLAHLPELTGVCKGCGCPITYKMLGSRPSRQYCSRSCQLKHTTPTKLLACIDCGRQFEFVGRTRRLRCDECRRKHLSRCVMRYRAAKDPSVLIGVGSGGRQVPKTSETAEQEAKRAHSNELRRERYRNHGSVLRLIGRSGYRRKALERSRSCAICGYDKSVDALVAHHIDMDRTNNAEVNLVVLCANCHVILHKRLKRLRRSQPQVSPIDVYKQLAMAETKSRNQAGNPDRATRTEGCEESQSGATHTGTPRTGMSRHEAATASNG